METIEEITPLEEFHQLVLFKLMDEEIEEWITWVGLSVIGEVELYKREPRNTGKVGNVYYNLQKYVTIPDGTDWRDCKWKL